MRRSLDEIPYEPYFILLKLLNLIRELFQLIPFIKKHVKTKSTLHKRLSIWATNLTSLQRTIGAILKLEQHSRAFVGQRQLISVSI